jgi:DNA polymerase-3 subunit alpha (Gram-positive type)
LNIENSKNKCYNIFISKIINNNKVEGEVMSEKLRVLLEKINIDEEYYSFFDNGKIVKLLIDKDNKIWNFIIRLEKMLDVEILKKFESLLFLSFDNLNDVYVTFEYDEFDSNKLDDYYKYVLSKLNLLKMFENHKYEIIDDKMIIKVLNKIEFNKINKSLANIETQLRRYGFNYEIDTLIDDEERIAVKEEIEKDIFIKVEPTKEVDPIILGTEIKSSKIISLKEIIGEEPSVIVEVFVFGIETFESSKNDFKILTLKISDNTDSLLAKVFTRDKDEYVNLCKRIKQGNWYKIRGYIKNDTFAKDFVLNIRDIMEIDSKDEEIIDDAPVKRVELHTHTFMSQMDGLINPESLVKRAYKWHHRAVAITDHNVVQAFPEVLKAYKGIKKKLKEGETLDFKIIYGTELNLIDDSIEMVFRESDLELLSTTFVVFDFETTGFNAGGSDSIIEVGAVKILNGNIIDRFSELINPGVKISSTITEVTNITNEMLEGKDDEETVIKRFIEWTGDLPMVAHNAKFDASFLASAYRKYNFGVYSNPLIDTLELSRALDPNQARHSLSALVKRYEIPWDETAHHRADYDAEGTALIFHKMIKKLEAVNIERIDQIKNLIAKEDLHKFGSMYHFTILVKNQIGIRNLYKLISLANTKYLYKTPRILRSEVNKYREGLLIGSSCYQGEIFLQARSKSEEELANLMSFYDYIEIQPLSVYSHLIQMNDFANVNELRENVEKIIRVANKTGKIVVATGDVHHLDKKDKIYREIIVNQKVPGGGRHPLARDSIKEIPCQDFKTTNDMLEEFNFLDKDLAYEIVVTNTNKIADMIENIKIIKDEKEPYTPNFKDSDKETTEMVYKRAKEVYGDPLPELIEKRIEKELAGIIGGGFDIIYLIAQKLVKKSNDDGYIVGSRGSVGSSFVAHMMGITEVNALSPHYICPNCKKSIFEIDGRELGADYASGYDLPDKICECGTKMKKDGHDIPFATFLGFNADKVPDIDLNFSGDYQSKAHDYTKVLFGDEYVYRAGTIGTVADKTAFGYVKGYFEDHGITRRNVEVERLAIGCTGVKRTTGQHPGGIVVIPNYMDVYDFTAFQYPADDATSSWYTTHFDFHAIHDYVLKLDILGHDDPTVLRMLQDLSGIDIKDIPLDDPDVYKLFTSPEVLGVTKEQIMCDIGTLGLPEMGTKFVIQMLLDTKPTSFGELVKISGLSHGTDVWLGNAQELIKNNTCEFKEVIGCRDDIMVYLMYHGLEPLDAFKIMEFVRKGKPSQEPEEWHKWKSKMQDKGIVDWYIDSCFKIKYMFPKAHATAYVMMAIRVAYFKVHYPILYYAAYFSVRTADYDIEAMIKGYETIKSKIIDLNNKGYDKSNKEESISDVLALALEMTARGFKFGQIDLYKSDSMKFVIATDGKTLIPPFRAIDGLGDTVAKKIVEEREKGIFISIEDLQKRAKVSQTLIDKMRTMGILKDMPDTNQLTLF